MSRQLAHHLFHIMRGATRRQSLGNLRRQGHRRVAVLRFGEIEMMLDMAVRQALASSGLDLDEEALDKLNAETRARFLALREERDSLRSTVDELRQQQKELDQNRGALRQELRQAEAELADRGQGGDLDAQAEADLDALRAQLRSGLTEVLSVPAGEELTRKAVDVALAAVAQHRRALLAREDAAQGARQEQLRRRIARLRARLQESETLLARARAAARPVQVTIGAQQQAAHDPAEVSRRRALLEELLHMNLELRRLTRSSRAARATSSPEPKVEALT